MNKLSVCVSVDRKAAALRGLILGETVQISVGPEDLSPENWAYLISQLNSDMTKFQMYHEPVVSGAEVADLLTGLEELRAKQAAERANDEAREQQERQRYSDKCAARDSALEEARKIVRGDLVPAKVTCGLTWMSEADRERFAGLSYDGFEAPELPQLPWISMYDRNDADRAQEAALEAIKTQLKERVITANREALEVARPQLEIAARERDEATAIAEAKAQEEKKALYAKRLETGTWEMETPSYKSKRYSAYWVAKVTFPSGPKAVYEFGDSTGRWGEAGMLSIDCAPGEIIAWGQKDLRRPGDSEHHILIMREDGHMETLDDKVEAYKVWKASKKD